MTTWDSDPASTSSAFFLPLVVFALVVVVVVTRALVALLVEVVAFEAGTSCSEICSGPSVSETTVVTVLPRFNLCRVSLHPIKNVK